MAVVQSRVGRQLLLDPTTDEAFREDGSLQLALMPTSNLVCPPSHKHGQLLMRSIIASCMLQLPGRAQGDAKALAHAKIIMCACMWVHVHVCMYVCVLVREFAFVVDEFIMASIRMVLLAIQQSTLFRCRASTSLHRATS